MNGADAGWHAYPGAIHPRTAVDDPARFPPVEPGRVVALGAICDLVPRRLHEATTQTFLVREFVVLEDGRRVVLHEARGFTVGWRSGESTFGESRDQDGTDMRREVLNVVLPDDESGDAHPWSWLADLARARGLNVTADGLRGLPYEVIFTDEVRRWLGSD